MMSHCHVCDMDGRRRPPELAGEEVDHPPVHLGDRRGHHQRAHRLVQNIV